MSRIFGFKHAYSQKFLDQLAKDLGFEWTPVVFKCIDKEKISVCPMPPPSGQLLYMDIEYKKN